jgi:hypothetical protein
VIHAESVDHLTLDHFKFPPLPDIAQPIFTNKVGKLTRTP